MSSNREMPSPKVSAEPKKAVISEAEQVSESKAIESIPGSDSLVKILPQKGSIEVVAIRPGFYKSVRREVGNEFKVANMDQLGDWMKCKDPEVELKHQMLMADKKKKRRAGL